MGFADELRNMPDLQESRWQYQLGEEVRHLKGRCEAAARDGKRHLTGVEVRFRPLAYCDEYETIWMDGWYSGAGLHRHTPAARSRAGALVWFKIRRYHGNSFVHTL